MTSTLGLRGVFSAVLTPVDGTLQPDASRAIPYYARLLERGCDGLNLLGTTGESMSFSAEQRLAFMRTIAQSALPLERLMVGTGAAALADTVRLTRAAFELGFAAALIIPPFYFRGISDDGVNEFFERLFAAVPPPEGRVLLYNFPAMSGVTFTAQLVERMTRAFPGIIAGVKDSSNDLALQRAIHAACPQLAVFPGSETQLEAARADGLAGCISGSVALWPDLAARVWREGDAETARQLCARREALAGVPLIAAVRLLTAKAENDDAWLKSIPPLEPIPDSAAERILSSIA